MVFEIWEQGGPDAVSCVGTSANIRCLGGAWSIGYAPSMRKTSISTRRPSAALRMWFPSRQEGEAPRAPRAVTPGATGGKKMSSQRAKSGGVPAKPAPRPPAPGERSLPPGAHGARSTARPSGAHCPVGKKDFAILPLPRTRQLESAARGIKDDKTQGVRTAGGGLGAMSSLVNAAVALPAQMPCACTISHDRSVMDKTWATGGCSGRCCRTYWESLRYRAVPARPRSTRGGPRRPS